jgi:DNA-directed RNA polymerase subunit RPC12/RpoP
MAGQANGMVPETTITCIDCGGVAHLLTTWPEDDPPQPGDIMSYRCSDCNDRWDLVLPEEDE